MSQVHRLQREPAVGPGHVSHLGRKPNGVKVAPGHEEVGMQVGSPGVEGQPDDPEVVDPPFVDSRVAVDTHAVAQASELTKEETSTIKQDSELVNEARSREIQSSESHSLVEGLGLGF
jgi:hypothetical protein